MYRLLQRIAVGGMAEVLLAEDGAGARVVVKRVLDGLAGDPDLAEMFREEGEIAARLEHPNVVRVLDRVDVEGAPALVLEWLDGLDLRALLAARGALPPGVACRVGADVARGLAHAHALTDASGALLGVVHRDVSPGNVFVTRDGIVKLLDFGIARVRRAAPRTRAGMARGKVPYMAPEQLAGLRVDGRADVFALGSLVWEMLVGEALWGDDAARAIPEESARPPSSVRRELPGWLDALVLPLLGKFASFRPDAATVAAKLDDAAAHLGASAADVAREVEAARGAT